MFARSMLSVLFLLAFLSGTLQTSAEQITDYSALVEPSYADRLALTDEQRVAIAKVLDERFAAMATAEPDERPQVLLEWNNRLENLLTEEQKSVFVSLLGQSKLRFDFRLQKWPEVLDWFSRQAELSLVMDAVPPGEFTYSDTREYSAAEAIDLLNSVLLSKGFTLMRREKMLLVVDTSEGIPFELTPRVTVEELANRGRFEMVTVEFPLGGRPVNQCVAAVQELIGNHGRVTPLATAGKLLVTETAGKLQAINVVIAAIPLPQSPKPKPNPPAPVFAVYPAKGLDPQVTVEMLQGLFKSASIKADPAAEEIHVHTVPAEQSGIKASLDKMIANVSGGNRPHLETYVVKADDLSQVISQLILAVPKARITSDESQDRLIVFGNHEQQAEVKQALKKLGVAGPTTLAEATVVVYPVENEETEPLVKLLQQVVPRALVVAQPGRIAVRSGAIEQELARTTIDQFSQVGNQQERLTLQFYPLRKILDSDLLSAIQQMIPNSKMTLLDDGQQLSVLASSADHKLISATLHQIDADFPLATNRTLETYSAEGFTADELQEVLAPLALRAHINADVDRDQIIVWGSKSEHGTISSILEKLSTDAAPDETLQLFPVSQAAAPDILEAVQFLVPDAQSSLHSSNRHLIVIGGAKEHRLIGELVEKLTPDEATSRNVLIGYALEQADAAAVVEMLQELRSDLRFAADARANRVLVTAPLSEQPRMQAVIEQLDAAPNESQEHMIKSYRLTTLDPHTVMELLQPLLPNMSVTVDQPSKSLLVSGTEFDHQKLAEVISHIDVEDSSRGQVESYEIGTADPEEVRNVLMQLVPQAIISLNASARQLLVWAEESDHSVIKQAMDQLARQQPDQTHELQTYPIPEVIRSTVLTVIETVAPEVSCSLDVSGKQLVCWGTAAQQEKVHKVLDELMRNLPQPDDLTLRVYQAPVDVLRYAKPLLADVAPKARLVGGGDKNEWLVWSTAEEQLAIAELMSSLEEQLTIQQAPSRTIKAYPLHGSDVSMVRQVIHEAVSDAHILDSSVANRLIVQATEKEHTTIAHVLENLTEALQQPDSSVQVYLIDRKRIAAQAIADSLDAELTEDVSIQVNEKGNSLIVRAPESDHARLKAAIDSMMDQLPETPSPQTKVYSLRLASPETVHQAVTPLVPNAVIAADVASGNLLVTATATEHQQIAGVIEKLDVVSGQQPVTKAYQIRQADADAVYQSVSQAFANSNDFSVTYQAAVRTLFVVATPKNHAVFAELIKSIDRPGDTGDPRFAKVYSMEDVAGEAAASALDTLFQGQMPAVKVEYNSTAKAMIVVADSNQHKAVDEVLGQLTGNPLEVEVFELQSTDPFVVENAIDRLFVDVSAGEAPSVSGDYSTQKLFVRGTKTQIEQIRQLLVKMGEAPLAFAEERQTGAVRTVPFRGDTLEAAKKIELIWPRLGANRIQVMTPSKPDFKALHPGEPSEQQPEIRGPKPTGEDSGDVKAPSTNRDDLTQKTQFVALQDSTRRPAPDDSDSKPRSESDESERATIVVVPENGRLTIASSDHEALDQLETLLRAMARSDSRASTSPNFAVFILKNTGAAEMQLLLEKLFDDLPATRGGLGPVAFVADERLNALVVHGTRKDRETVEELLQVLDTEEMPDSLHVNRPELILLENTQARRVLAILENVYKTQLKSGGGRKQVQIPTGVSAGVASVLQQINAVAAGPLLTLDVDEATNSLVMRAPPELSKEIKTFVQRLDTQVAEIPNRQVRIIQLKHDKADRMQAILEQFLLQTQE